MLRVGQGRNLCRGVPYIATTTVGFPLANANITSATIFAQYDSSNSGQSLGSMTGWNDVSGNGRNLTIVGGTAPVLTANQFLTYPGVVFGGAGYFQGPTAVANAMSAENGPFTVIVIGHPTVLTATPAAFVMSNLSSAGTTLSGSRIAMLTGQQSATAGNGSTTSASTDAASCSTTHHTVWAGVFHGTQPAFIPTLYIGANGGVSMSVQSSPGSIAALTTDCDLMGVGANLTTSTSSPTVTDYLTGVVGGVFIFTGQMSTTDLNSFYALAYSYFGTL